MGETVGKAGIKEGFTVVAGETTVEAVGVGVGDAVMVGFAEGDPEVEGDTVGVIVDKGVLVAGKVVCVGVGEAVIEDSVTTGVVVAVAGISVADGVGEKDSSSSCRTSIICINEFFKFSRGEIKSCPLSEV